jgi:hypothetical protein
MRTSGSARHRRTCRWWRVRAARLDLQFPHHVLRDPASRQTGVNNLQLPGTAMPHVLASLQGVQSRCAKTSRKR